VDNWSQVEELFHAALAQPPDRRAEFLRQMCPEDSQLRGEVQALLEKALTGGFLNGSPLSSMEAAPPALSPGQKVGSFEILELIGRGGMGEVYKARDTRLGRMVALKRSRRQFSDRFEREARAIAALNHPNICTLYDVTSGYLVIEFLEGTPLDERIGAKPVAIGQLIEMALQIADALAAAHGKGIIHRDIKPGNIFVTGSNSGGPLQVKVLDFGLAKLAEESPEGLLTQPGSTVGTVAYMSPEQARGESLDVRTDLFSLGVVLYEMATGRLPFQGSTHALVFEALLRREPTAAMELNPEIPGELDRMIRKLLDKDRNLRYQTAADLMADLRRVQRDLSKTMVVQARMEISGPQPAGGRPAAWSKTKIAAAAAVLALVVAGLLLVRGPRETQPVYHLMITTPKLDVSDGGRLALSRDGRRIAFIPIDESGTRHLMVRSLDSDVTQSVASAADARNYPAWSPDGRSIAYFTSNSLNTVDVGSGQVTRLVNTQAISRGAAWGQGRQILVTSLSGSGRNPLAIYAIPEAGGEPQQVTFPVEGKEGHVYPQFLPDGKRFLFCVFAGQTGREELRLGTIGSRETRSLGTVDGNVALAGPNTLVFRRGETLYAQRVNRSTMAFVGEPVRLVDNIRYYAVNGFGAFSVSETGVLAFRRGGNTKTRLRWFDRSGKPLGTIGEAAAYWSFDLWRDGAKIVVNRDPDPAVGTEQIWLGDAAHGPAVRLTSGSANEPFAVWSPDGERLAYTVDRGTLMLRDFAGEGSDRVLLQSSKALWTPAWSPDGRLVAIAERTPASSRILLVPVDRPNQAAPLIGSETFRQTMPQFSPDGRWIAYCSDETGIGEVYVRRFPEVNLGKWAVSSGGGVQPRWRADGREILYIHPPNQLVSAPIDTRGAKFQVGKPMPLFAQNVPWSPTVRYQYALSSDGRRILANVLAEEDDRSIEVLLHWDSLLR
jgi:serine/threonine protein kinase/Tol biopolymer transport system component